MAALRTPSDNGHDLIGRAVGPFEQQTLDEPKSLGIRFEIELWIGDNDEARGVGGGGEWHRR